MKKTLIALVLICSLSLELLSQKGSWGEFPMIPAKSFAARKAAANRITGTPAYQKALRVYERLREARGDFRYPVPTFYMTQKETVAEIDYISNCIYLGEKAFKVCESFGNQSEAAIAFLLGHELTHYYEKHAWRGNFSDDYEGLKLSKNLSTLYKEMLDSATTLKMKKQLMRFDTLSQLMDHAEREIQSDYLGGYLAYSAGYGTFDKGDVLIGRLYQEFNMGDSLPGYATRGEREEMSRQSAQRMKDLVEVFDMANMLTATEQYEDAYRYYRKVLMEYQSRELYNNVGATAMMHAMKKYIGAEELKFRYPVQLDLEMAKSRGPGEDSIMMNLLKQAIQHFDAAISMDPNYAPAYLNKACALALLGDRARAYFYADVEARSVSTGKYAGNLDKVEVLLGILDATSNTPDAAAKARARFEKAKATDLSGLAAYNLAKLNNEAPAPAPEDPGANEFFDDESIDGKDVSLMLYPEEDKMRTIDEILTFHQNTTFTKNSRIYFNRRSGDNSILFQAASSTYKGETARGIKSGATKAAIEKKYGVPRRSILTPDGQILVYPQILFIMKGDALERWVLVRKF